MSDPYMALWRMVSAGYEVSLAMFGEGDGVWYETEVSGPCSCGDGEEEPIVMDFDAQMPMLEASICKAYDVWRTSLVTPEHIRRAVDAQPPID